MFRYGHLFPPRQWKVMIMYRFNSLFQSGVFIEMKALSWRVPEFVISAESYDDKSQIGDNGKWTVTFCLYSAVRSYRSNCPLLCLPLRYFKYFLHKLCLLCKVATGRGAVPWSCFLLPREVETWQPRVHEKADYNFGSQPCCVTRSISLRIKPHFH